MYTDTEKNWLDQMGLELLHDGTRLNEYERYLDRELSTKMKQEDFDSYLKCGVEKTEIWSQGVDWCSITSTLNVTFKPKAIKSNIFLSVIKSLGIMDGDEFLEKNPKNISNDRIFWCKRNSGMIEEYRGYQFAMYRLYDDRQKRMITELQAYVRQPDRMFDTLGLMVFSGSPGTGKTVLSHCMINEVINRTGNPCRFVRFPNLLSEMVRAISDHKTTIHALTEAIINTQLLVLDEVGYDATDFTWKQLLDIVDKRLVARRPTVIVTNFSPEALGKMMGEKYKALYSRMFSNSTITYLCEWQDYRQWEVRG